MLNKWFMFSFAGLSMYTLLANNPECKRIRTEDTQTLVTSTIIVEPVIQHIQPEMVYENGECYGSYGGHYMILWQKQPVSDWQVMPETNY
jgi:hypothetical protein